MTWFKVDDGLHASDKVHRAGEAMALWVLAGSWCADQLTDGWVPEAVVRRLMPRKGRAHAQRLVAVGLWTEQTRTLPVSNSKPTGEYGRGFLFHDWSDYQPTSAQVKAERANAAERQKRAREKAKSRRESRRDTDDSHAVSHGVSHGPPDPTRPLKPSGGALSGQLTPGATRLPEPPPRCPQHLNEPTDRPCRGCGVAREAHAAWELSEAERRRTWRHCRTHRGQPAHNCAMCRSETLSPPEDAE